MIQQDKELLLKDLCARLSYGVICQFIWTYSNETTPVEGAIAKKDDKIRCINIHLKEIQADYYDEWVDLENCKPYLRPMHKLTKEELEELEFLTDGDYVDYCNKHHIDYRNLIPKGLALEALDNMYKIDLY